MDTFNFAVAMILAVIVMLLLFLCRKFLGTIGTLLGEIHQLKKDNRQLMDRITELEAYISKAEAEEEEEEDWENEEVHSTFDEVDYDDEDNYSEGEDGE